MNREERRTNIIVTIMGLIIALIVVVVVIVNKVFTPCELCNGFLGKFLGEKEHNACDLAYQSEKLQVVKQVTFLNSTNDMMFQMTGRIHIEQDDKNKQLEITVKNEDDTCSIYQIHLGDNTTYIVDNKEINYTKPYPFTILYNPDIQLPAYTQISEKE